MWLSPLSARFLCSCHPPCQPGSHFTKSVIVFDINLDYTNAMNRLQYLVDGHYLDNATDNVDVTVMSFNGRFTGNGASERASE